MKNGAGEPASFFALQLFFFYLQLPVHADRKDEREQEGKQIRRRLCEIDTPDRRGEQVRENQRLAMQLFQRRCGELCYFALKLPDETIWMISLERIKTLEVRGKKRITDGEIRTQTWSLEKWMEASNEWGKDV